MDDGTDKEECVSQALNDENETGCSDQDKNIEKNLIILNEKTTEDSAAHNEKARSPNKPNENDDPNKNGNNKSVIESEAKTTAKAEMVGNNELDTAEQANNKVGHIKNSDNKQNEQKSSEEKDGEPDAKNTCSTPISTSVAKESTPINTPQQKSSASSGKSSSRSNTPVNKEGAKKNNTVRSKTPTTTPGTKKSQNATKKAVKSKVTQVLGSSVSSSDSFRPIAQLLFDTGVNLIKQHAYKDLIRIQRKKEGRGELDDKDKVQLEKLSAAYSDLIDKNESYIHDTMECGHCHFKTDSRNILSYHLEYAHDQNLGIFSCALCRKDGKDVNFPSGSQFHTHMDSEHNRRGRMFNKHAFFVCPNCPYESNNSSQFEKHSAKCARVFNSTMNLLPLAPDKDIPLTNPRPPAPKAPPAKSVAPKAPQPPQQQPPRAPIPSMVFQRPPTSVPSPSSSSASVNSQLSQFIQQAAAKVTQQRHASPVRAPVPAVRPAKNAQSPAARAKAPTGPVGDAVVNVNGKLYKLTTVGAQQFLIPLSSASSVTDSLTANSPTVVNAGGKVVSNVTSARRPTAPSQPPASAGSFEVCEICGGFVKDLEALRIHFHWAHKVNIHTDVFKNKNPPLSCPVCKKPDARFWTIQGLTKHRSQGCLNRVHKLIDEIAKECIYCLQTFPTDISSKQFWSHMTIHGIGVKSIFRVNKCCACGAKIQSNVVMKQHLLSKHGSLFEKETLDKALGSVQNAVKVVNTDKKTSPRPTTTSAVLNKPRYPCDHCVFVAMDPVVLSKHIAQSHPIKCSRCVKRFDNVEIAHMHFSKMHGQERDKCQVCKEQVRVGRSYIRHMKSEHLKECSVVAVGLSKATLADRKNEIDGILAKIAQFKKTPNKRKTTPQKRGLEMNSGDSQPPTKKARSSNGSEVLEVDGEKIVVQLQDQEDAPGSIKIASTHSLADSKLTNGDVSGSENVKSGNQSDPISLDDSSEIEIKSTTDQETPKTNGHGGADSSSSPNADIIEAMDTGA